MASEMADGTFTTTFTPAAISGQYASNDPEEAQFTDGFTSLTGMPISMSYGPDGAFYGASPADGATATEEQEQWLVTLEFPDYSLPSTPIGVGATWTAPLNYGAGAAFGTGTANYRLDAVNGDQFSVSVTMDVDLAAVQPDALTDSLTGLVAVRTTITGSLTTATQLSITTESTVDYQGSYSYGVDESFHRFYRRTYVETPAS